MHKTEKLESKILVLYILGFLACVTLTLLAYLIIDREWFSKQVALPAIIILGIIQVYVQLVCFLRLGVEPKPRIQLLVFLFMLLVLVIIVGGSLWIMNNLDYRTMNMEMMQ